MVLESDSKTTDSESVFTESFFLNAPKLLPAYQSSMGSLLSDVPQYCNQARRYQGSTGMCQLTRAPSTGTLACGCVTEGMP